MVIFSYVEILYKPFNLKVIQVLTLHNDACEIMK